MSELRTSAPTAVEKVSELQADLETARQSLGALETLAATLSEQMDADWAAFTERARDVLARAASERSAVVERSQAAVEALGELDGAVDQARQEAEQGIEAAEEAVQELAEMARTTSTQADQVLDTVDAAGQQLAGHVQAAGQAAATSLSGARDLLQNEVFGELRDLEAVLQREKDAFVQSFNEATFELQESYELWQQRLDDTERIVEDAFAQAREHFEQVTQFALEQCATAYAAELDQVAELARRLDTAVEGLSEAVRKAQGEVPAAGQDLREELEGHATGLRGLLSGVGKVQDLLESLRLSTPRG